MYVTVCEFMCMHVYVCVCMWIYVDVCGCMWVNVTACMCAENTKRYMYTGTNKDNIIPYREIYL